MSSLIDVFPVSGGGIDWGHQVQTMKIEGMTIKRISNDTKEF